EHPRVADVLDNQAWLCVVRGELDCALRLEERSVDVGDRHAAILLTTGSDEQKRAYMSTLEGGTYSAISLHVRLMPNAREATRLALTASLRRKGRALEAMTDGFAALRRRLTPDDQARFDHLRSISARYSSLALSGPGATPVAQYARALATLDAERQ